jgi:hypothetical protein
MMIQTLLQELEIGKLVQRRKGICLILSLLTIASSPLFAAKPYVGDPARVYPPVEKLKSALEGTMGFPPSPSVPEAVWSHDKEGFALDRLFSIPEVGVHPRILFGPKDLGKIRERFKNVKSSRDLLTGIREGVAKGIDDPQTWEGQCFESLLKGDLVAFKAAYKPNPLDNIPPGSGFKYGKDRKPAVKWGTRNVITAALEMKALLALLDQDEVAGKKVAQAICAYADYIRPQVDLSNQGDWAPFHWASQRDWVHTEVGFIYDWNFVYMTPEQREKIRQLIADSIRDKYTLGYDLPNHWRNWNHLGMNVSLLINNFAIEGEKGYVPQIADRHYEVIRDYLTYGNSPAGGPKEGIGYHTMGFGHLTNAMLAYANRGKNLWTHNHLRRLVDSALVMHIDCRTDTTFPSHDHPDRGQFTFSSHGRAWASTGYRDTESKFMNIVTIDNRGQGYFPTPGRWVAREANGEVSLALMDVKYCYDWFWMKSMFTESEEMLKRRHQAWGIPPMQRLLKRFPLDQWEADPLPSVKRYYEGYVQKMDPRMWDDEDAWILRAPWYPVKRATRAEGLIRGKHPYMLITDDLQKDENERLYEWRMNMPPDVEVVSIKGNDLLIGDQTTHRTPYTEQEESFQFNFQRPRTLLTPEKGDRLLLVRTLDRGEPSLPTLQDSPRLQSIEYLKLDDTHQFAGRSLGQGKQVIIPARSTEAKTKVLLFPHRSGEAIPQTTWNEDKTVLTIQWKDQTDIVTFKRRADGIEAFTVSRNGKIIGDLVRPKSMTTAPAGMIDGR